MRGRGAIILICLVILAVCFIMIQRQDASPLSGTGLSKGQQIIVSDLIPGCGSLKSFELYTDLGNAKLLDDEELAKLHCSVLEKGTQIKLIDASMVSTKTVENVKVVETAVLSGPNKGQMFWCTVENLASVTPGANY
jgi:hypothetical protein